MYNWHINRQDDFICVTILDVDFKEVALFRLSEGHLAFGWTDEKLKDYLLTRI